MADDGSAQDAIWPLPQFYFNVDFGDGRPQGFSEVSGIESDVKPIEYRHGDSAVFSRIKMPGLRSVGNVTLKKGVITEDSMFWRWFAETRVGILKRRTVIVNLSNENDEPMMTWTLANALPIKMQAIDMKSDDSAVAIETLEIAYETLTQKAG